MLIRVTPIYGWGWTDGDRTLLEPGAFEIETSEWDSESPAGVVATRGHDLAGYQFSGSPRHVERDSVYNCTLAPGASSAGSNKPTIHGYCIILPPSL